MGQTNKLPDYCIAGAIGRACLQLKGTGCPGHDFCYRGDECKKKRKERGTIGHGSDTVDQSPV